MKTNKVFINLGLILILGLSVAFKCGAGEETVTNKTEAADLKGTWYYTALIDENGKVTKLANRVTSINFKADGNYEQDMGYRSIIGTYKVDGNRLTMHPENTDPRVYTMVFGDGGATLTLKATDGSAYELERGK